MPDILYLENYLPYRPELFAGRESILKECNRLIDKWNRGRLKPEERVRGLIGEHGAGKTWVLRQLHHIHKGRILYIEFSEAIENFKGILSGPKAILLDAVPPEYKGEKVYAFENYIANEVEKGGSLLIMALERPYQICWTNQFLRSFEPMYITLFREKEVEEQLKRLEKIGIRVTRNNVKDILEKSWGHPCLAYLLATCKDEKQAFRKLLDAYLRYVEPNERDSIEHYLYALCTLDKLEFKPMEKALKEYHQDNPDAPGFPTNPIKVRTLLSRYGFTYPGPSGVPVLSKALRASAQGLLRLR